MPEHKLLIGTTKGLVQFERGKDQWEVTKVHFRGFPVSFFFEDRKYDAWWIGLAHRHWGAKMYVSYDRGETWQEERMPTLPAELRLPNGRGATMKKIWTMQRAGNKLFLGIEPGAIMERRDGSEDWVLNRGLWDHPSRQDPNQWFGAGRDLSFVHSIVVDPQDDKHFYVAVSCAGVFETRDGGASWMARNTGLVAAYLPNPSVEVGHDPHRVLCCESQPEVLWQQNHCGIFRSSDAGETWSDVTDKNGLANYGFALAIDHNDPNRAWVIPAVSDEERVAADLALCVCQTDDGGATWHALRNGLPQEFCFDIVFRHSFDRARDGSLMVFGTSNGNVYTSETDGTSWSLASHRLARVETVHVVES